MAENKKAFVLYADLIHTVNKMPDDKAGELLKHILSYVNDEEPTTDDLIIQLTFEPIKQQLKRDLRKYEVKKKQWSEAGKRSAEARKAKKNERTLTDVAKRSTDLTVSVTDSVSVKDINNNNREVDVDFKQIDLWIKEIGSSPTYLESFYRLNNLEKGTASKLLEDFKDHLKMNPEAHPHFSAFKKHFNNWVRRTDKSKYQFRSKGML